MKDKTKKRNKSLFRPRNLLVTVDHQLKITDFGTAEQLDPTD